jgi:alkylation response protein AidB-like acyl-CoA dehydrogenase
MTQPITLSDEQREFRDVVRRFAADKIAPLAADTDRTAEYSWPAFEALKSMELTALSYPVDYGGSGASTVDQAIVTEELAAACASTSLMFLISKLGMLPVLNFGSEEIKQSYLPRIATGASLASSCLS